MEPSVDLAARGRALWVELVATVPPVRRVLLEEACRLADRLDRLHAANSEALDVRLLAEARNTTLALRVVLAELSSGVAPASSKGSKLDDLAERRRRRESGPL